MVAVEAPVDQLFPEAYDEVRSTVEPLHRDVVPFAVITGCAGFAFTNTTCAAEEALVQPFASVT